MQYCVIPMVQLYWRWRDIMDQSNHVRDLFWAIGCNYICGWFSHTVWVSISLDKDKYFTRNPVVLRGLQKFESSNVSHSLVGASLFFQVEIHQ